MCVCVYVCVCVCVCSRFAAEIACIGGVCTNFFLVPAFPFACVAQVAERDPPKVQAVGSNPIVCIFLNSFLDAINYTLDVLMFFLHANSY